MDSLTKTKMIAFKYALRDNMVTDNSVTINKF